MTTFKHFLVTALVAAGLAFAAGCKHIQLDNANKNIGAFNFGEFSGRFNKNKATVVTDATRNAIKQLGLVEVAVTPEKFGTTIVCRDENDLAVTIRVEEINSLQTKLRVRWGKGGDLERSRQLYGLVEQALGGR